MSSSAISAAKRRTETALKNYKIPTTADYNEPQDTNDQVLLSLLQSRTNWSTNVFIKYRPDPEQQPKRNNIIRRRFPMMREIGQATLELGPHLFYETSFYEAIRSESWISLGKTAGVDGLDAYETKPPLEQTIPLPPPKIEQTIDTMSNINNQQLPTNINEDNNKGNLTNDMATQPTNSTVNPSTQSLTIVDNQTMTLPSSLDTTNTILPDTTTTDAAITSATATAIPATDTNVLVMKDATSGPPSSAQNAKYAIDWLVYRDIVIEFKDQPSERYLFPKDIIMQVLEDAVTAKLSFMLPLDRTCADCFFWDANKKIQHFGHQSLIPEIKAMSTIAATTTYDTTPATSTVDTSVTKAAPSTIDEQQYQPVNIRLLDASPAILNALRSTIHNPDQVRTKMISQMQKVPDRSYLDYSIPKSERKAISGLIHRVHTQPDIISGPIAAEKKRNEIGLAIKLGKRPETDQHEAEPPKTKQHLLGKNDGFRRCVYCSTRYTAMWRKGPAGEGTLCNGCGILWLQGKILIGAPVISKEDERRKLKEKWRIARRQREQEEWHWKQQRIKEEQEMAIKEKQEAAYRMDQCLRAKKRQALSSHRFDTTGVPSSISPPLPNPPPTQFNNAAPTIIPPPFPNMTTHPEQMNHCSFEPPLPHIATNGNHTGVALGMVAAQIAHQQHQKQLENGNINTQMTTSNAQMNTQPQSLPTPILATPHPVQVPVTTTTSSSSSSVMPASTSTSTGVQPSTSSTQSSTSSSSSSSSSSYHIFDLPQIPLPTLSIEFSNNTVFSHPHCTVALSQQKQVSIQLIKDNVSVYCHIPREALATTTKFEILGQIDSAGRDILLMSCTPEDIGQGPGVPLEAFGSVLFDPKDPQRGFKIRFLEKIDATGGPVVKKILECWLAEKK